MLDLRRRHPDVICLLLLPMAVSFLVVACGSEEAPTPTQSPAEQPASAAPAAAKEVAEESGGAPIVRPDRTYTIDDVVAGGYKKSKEYPIDTLPNATAAWYGFFNQKDVEVWVYATHEEAVEFGTGPADEATGREWRQGGGEKGAGTKAMFTYGAYMIVGNLVLLCELDLANCESLVANMD